MKDYNVILDKTFNFAIRIVRLYTYLKDEKKEFVLSKQVLRSGTSIGANIREAVKAQSKADFLSKLYIAYKEAGETEYWIDLLSATGFLSEREFSSMKDDCIEIIKILTTIIKSLKEQQ